MRGEAGPPPAPDAFPCQRECTGIADRWLLGELWALTGSLAHLCAQSQPTSQGTRPPHQRTPLRSFTLLCLPTVSGLLTFPSTSSRTRSPRFLDALGSFAPQGKVGMGNVKKRRGLSQDPNPPRSFFTCPSTQKHSHVSRNSGSIPARAGIVVEATFPAS